MVLFETSGIFLLISVPNVLQAVSGADEEVNKAAERVLVHRFDVGQVSNRTEQNGTIHCIGSAAHVGLIHLLQDSVG